MGGGTPFWGHFICGIFFCLSLSLVKSEDAYRFYTWNVTYGTFYPLGVSQQVILINGQFPAPQLDVVTNDNIILNLFNNLDQPFLLTWNGIKQRKNSWQDGVLGTNCAIPPNSNYTYKFQAKDQIGTYTYFPSTLMHKAAGGYGALNIYKRAPIPIPYPYPDGDFTLLVGDWHKTNHTDLQHLLDSGRAFPFPDAILINGQTQTSFSGDQGKTYMFRMQPPAAGCSPQMNLPPSPGEFLKATTLVPPPTMAATTDWGRHYSSPTTTTTRSRLSLSVKLLPFLVEHTQPQLL